MVKMKKISEGAEADIYSTEVLGLDCILKRRRRKDYISKELDTWIRAHRTKTEARIIGIASMNGINVPKIILVSNNSIWMERIKGKMIDGAYKGNIPRIVLRRIGALLAKLHNLNIVHGDYTKANIMMKDDVPIAIDFGLASQTPAVEEKALDLLLLKRSLGDAEFGAACAQYVKTCKTSDKVIPRLDEIERRGRYQNRSIDMKKE